MHIHIYMYMHIMQMCEMIYIIWSVRIHLHVLIFTIIASCRSEPSHHHMDLNISCVHASTHMHTRQMRSEGVTWLTHLWHCNTLQHTATHYNTLQHTAKHYNSLQHTATHCNTLQHTATHCNTLQHTATHRGDENRGRDPCYSVVRCEYVESSV